MRSKGSDFSTEGVETGRSTVLGLVLGKRGDGGMNYGGRGGVGGLTDFKVDYWSGGGGLESVGGVHYGVGAFVLEGLDTGSEGRGFGGGGDWWSGGWLGMLCCCR